MITTFATPPGCDLDDEDAWHPALGDFLHIGALRSNRRTMCESSFRADRLGQWLQVDDKAWLPPGARDVCTAPGGELGDGAEVVLGFDGSFSGDCTALASWPRRPGPAIHV